MCLVMLTQILREHMANFRFNFNSKVCCFFFVALSLYTPMGSGVARRDSTHVTAIVNCLCIPCFKSRSKGLYDEGTIFGFFWA